MVQARLLSVDYLDPTPPATAGFMIAAQLTIGSEDAADIFQITICDAEWVAKRVKASTAMWPRGHLVVASFDAEHVKSLVEALVSQFAGAKDWVTFAERLNRYLLWEFEDVDDFQGDSVIPRHLS